MLSLAGCVLNGFIVRGFVSVPFDKRFTMLWLVETDALACGELVLMDLGGSVAPPPVVIAPRRIIITHFSVVL